MVLVLLSLHIFKYVLRIEADATVVRLDSLERCRLVIVQFILEVLDTEPVRSSGELVKTTL